MKVGPILLTIPTEYTESKGGSGLEGGSYKRFVYDKWTIDIDHSPRAWYPTFERNYQDYKEDVFSVSGVRAKIWSFSNNGSFVFGASYGNGTKGRLGLGVYLKSGPVNERELAECIFSSVKFVGGKPA